YTLMMSPAGLTRVAYEKFCEAQLKTPWGCLYQRRLTLMDRGDVCASAVRYDLTGVLRGRAVRICGVGSLSAADPADRHSARTLLDQTLDRAARNGADMALLFCP